MKDLANLNITYLRARILQYIQQNFVPKSFGRSKKSFSTYFERRFIDTVKDLTSLHIHVITPYIKNFQTYRESLLGMLC